MQSIFILVMAQQYSKTVLHQHSKLCRWSLPWKWQLNKWAPQFPLPDVDEIVSYEQQNCLIRRRVTYCYCNLCNIQNDCCNQLQSMLYTKDKHNSLEHHMPIAQCFLKRQEDFTKKVLPFALEFADGKLTSNLVDYSQKTIQKVSDTA